MLSDMGDHKGRPYGIPRRWCTPVAFLVLASIAMPLGFAAWRALLDNFAIEQAAFTGREIGFLQSLREIPGLLAFTAVFVILILREQTFAVISVAVFGVGVAITGFFPSEYGLYFTAVLMSIGFHYFETVAPVAVAAVAVEGRGAPHPRAA